MPAHLTEGCILLNVVLKEIVSAVPVFGETPCFVTHHCDWILKHWLSCGLIHGRQIHRAIITRGLEAEAEAIELALVALASWGGREEDVGVVNLSSPSSPGCRYDSETVRVRLRYLNNDSCSIVLYWNDVYTFRSLGYLDIFCTFKSRLIHGYVAKAKI